MRYETETLKTLKRLKDKDRRDDLFDLCSQLNWPQNTRFSNLSGAFPADDHLREQAHDFSVLESLLGVRPLCLASLPLMCIRCMNRQGDLWPNGT